MGGFQPQGRPELVGVVIQLLFGAMAGKRGRSRGALIVVMSSLSGITIGEMHGRRVGIARGTRAKADGVGMACSQLCGACGRFRKAAGWVIDFAGRRGEETMGPPLIACWSALWGMTG